MYIMYYILYIIHYIYTTDVCCGVLSEDLFLVDTRRTELHHLIAEAYKCREDALALGLY